MGGGEISLFNLVTNLNRTRFEPVVVLASDGPLREKLSARGVETHVLPLSEAVTQVRKDSLTGPGAVSAKQIGEIALYIWRLRGFACARGADIVHTNSLKADIIGALAGRFAGLPVIWHVRDRIADDYLPSLATRAFRLLCRILPHYVVVNSKSTLEALELPRGRRARVIYNGIVHDGLPYADFMDMDDAPDGADLAPHPGDVAHLNGHLGEVPPADQSAPCIGLVGRISAWKGQDVFLRAAAIVRQKYPRARFQIIGAPLFGEEDYERELHALSAELGLENTIEWLGFRSDVPRLVSRMTIFVHASKTGEPFGQVVVEAMMAARPVIATNGGGIPEIVRDGETGLLVPMDDAPAMAQAITRLLDEPALAREMGRAGLQRALDSFTIDKTVGKIDRLYDDVLLDRAVPTRNGLTGLWMLLAGLTFVVMHFLERRDSHS